MPPSIVNLKRPVINSPYIPSPTHPAPRSFDLNTLMYWIKKTPECIGILKRITNDIVTEISFEPIESVRKAGRPPLSQNQSKIDKADYFSKRNNFFSKAQALALDWAATGDNYLWKGGVDNSFVKESALKHYAAFGIEMKELSLSGFLEGSKEGDSVFFDEDYNGVSAIEIIPSTQVKIHHDRHRIIKYIQQDKQHPGNPIPFDPDEIIHGKFIDIDGSVYGYSPMEASYTAIRTVNSIQDYGWYYFENGAKIDRVWKFMGNPNPEYWKKFQENVSQYISVKKSHGHLFAAGAEKIESEKLNEISEEMEYRDLAIHSIGRMAFAFNMPADMLSSILGKDIKPTAGSSDVEDAGYYRNIERSQSYLENIWNTQLWIPFFGVRMHFERTFKQDQIRQIQYMGQTIPVIQFLQKNKFPLKDEYYYNLLQIDKSNLKEGKIEWAEEEEAQPFVMGKGTQGPKREAFQESKRQQQKPQQRNNPPRGV